MLTSANTIEYKIFKDVSKRPIGTFTKNMLCEYPNYAELLIYQPLSEHTIIAWGYDEDKHQWSDDPENLEDFLKKMKTNKWIKAYFSGEQTAEQIIQNLKDIDDEFFRKVIERLEKQREQRINEYKKSKK